MPTMKQISFIKKLLKEREFTMPVGAPPVEAYTVQAASELIDTLLKAPRRAAAAVANAFSLTVPGGRYAVRDDNGAFRFYIVNSPDKGRWVGWYFVDIQAGDERYKLGRQRPGDSYQGKGLDALRAIQADPLAASVAYGRELGLCGVCGRTLTDPESIAAGIGPVCASKF